MIEHWPERAVCDKGGLDSAFRVSGKTAWIFPFGKLMSDRDPSVIAIQAASLLTHQGPLMRVVSDPAAQP